VTAACGGDSVRIAILLGWTAAGLLLAGGVRAATHALTLPEAVQLALARSPAARRIALEEQRSAYTHAGARRGLWPDVSFALTAPEWSEQFAVAPLPSTAADTLGGSGEPPRLVYGKTTTTSRNAGGALRFQQLLPWKGALSADGSVTHHNEETSPTGVQASRLDYQVGAAIGIDVPLLGDDPARRALARADVEWWQARARARAARAELEFETVTQYVQLRRAELALESAAVEDTAAAEADDLARRKVASGLLADVDRVRMQLHRAERAAALASARAAVTRATDAFKVHLGLDASDSLALVEAWEPFACPEAADAWVARALAQRTEIGLLTRDIELLEMDRAARRPHWPRVDLAARYGGGSSESQLDTALRALAANDVSLRLSLQVPLWDAGRTSLDDAAARTDVALRALEAETTRARIELETRDAVRDLQEAGRRQRIYADSESLAQDLLHISTERYQRGAIDTQTYLGAQADAAVARLGSTTALLDMYLARARLHFVSLTQE
jgi:outer membrane protein, heavy metal efflux system